MVTNRQIGFDRSAFVTGSHKGEPLKSKESSERSIHNEGLPEHPTKTKKYNSEFGIKKRRSLLTTRKKNATLDTITALLRARI